MAEKILIVDDDLDTLRLVGLLLERKGYLISAAKNGREALVKASNESPDLILLDIMMPDMDGIEVLRRLRKDRTTSEIPIIMFTAKNQVEDKVLGFETGADDYLTKPTHPAELTARVRTILTRSAGKKKDGSDEGDPTQTGKVIGVLAAKGGLGVTTVALNLAVAMHEASDADVVFAELRPGLGNASFLLGMENGQELGPLLEKDAGLIRFRDIQKMMRTHPSGLRVLLSSFRPVESRFSGAADQMLAIVRELAREAEFVVVDLGVGLTPTAEKIAEISDKIFVIVEPMVNTLVQSQALLEELSMKVLGMGSLQVVQVNRTGNDMQLTLREIQDYLGHTVAAVVSAVPNLAHKAETSGIPLVNLRKDSPVSQQFTAIAEIALNS